MYHFSHFFYVANIPVSLLPPSTLAAGVSSESTEKIQTIGDIGALEYDMSVAQLSRGFNILYSVYDKVRSILFRNEAGKILLSPAKQCNRHSSGL